MTLVEMIEALHRELNEPGRHQGRLPEGLAIELSVKLDPILAAARAQGQELAAMKGQLQLEGMAHMLSVKNSIDELSLLKEQHSADLREIAEMALRMGMCDPALAQLVSGADRVLAAFREQQQKAEVKAQ